MDDFGRAHTDVFRCRRRSQARNTGENMFTPLTFPARPEQETSSDHAFLLPAAVTDADVSKYV